MADGLSGEQPVDPANDATSTNPRNSDDCSRRATCLRAVANERIGPMVAVAFKSFLSHERSPISTHAPAEIVGGFRRIQIDSVQLDYGIHRATTSRAANSNTTQPHI